MNWWIEILIETSRSVLAHKLRSALTMFGIAWGIASIIFMMAIGDGFKAGYKRMMEGLGKDIAILWGGRTSMQAGDLRAGRQIYLRYGDVQAIQQECYLIRDVTPELDRSLKVTSPFNSGLFSTHGVAPVYQHIRSMDISEGRLITDQDMLEGRSVCLIGWEVKKQLFAERPAVGTEVRIRDIPFTVIGLLQKKDQNNSYNGLDGDKVVVPYTAMARHFPDPRPFIGIGYLDNIIVTPVSPDVHDQALKQVRALLGRRHDFNPRDESALWIWDTVEGVRMVNDVYNSMQLFLAFVAVITLGLGGLGVMNIMLVSVAERTREIGVKKAIGATSERILAEFFLESLILTMTSGTIGVVFAFTVTSLVNRLPLPALFSGLPVTLTTALLAFGTLVIVGVLSAIYPARRAARLVPIEALRYE